MEINVRVEVQFNAPETTTLRDMLHMFRTPMWVRFMVRYIAPHLRNCAPTNHDALEKLTKRRCPGSERALCVVCMAETAEGVALPCGHVFHADCIEAWLKMRSTCPTCRFQLPKAFSGCYAVKTLNSALVLRPEHEQMEREAMMKTALGPGPVRAVVNVTLYHVADADRQQQFPCVLNALLLHSNGQVSADAAGSTAAEQPKPAEPVSSPTASSPTAFSASGSTSGSTSASASASAASLPSPAMSTSTTDRRRRRRADQEDETQEDATFACATKSPQASPPHHKRMRMTS